MAQAKFGGLKKKSPMLSSDKKKFDSADHFKEQEKLMKAAGMKIAEEDEKKEE